MNEDSGGNPEVRLSKLVSQHPDLAPLVADILGVCEQDHEKAYGMLCEMVIPSEPSEELKAWAYMTDSSSSGATPMTRTELDENRPEYTSIFQSAYIDVTSRCSSATSTPKSPFLGDSHSKEIVPETEQILQQSPRPSSQSTLRGAWAQKSMGRTFRADDLCNKYEWISRHVVEGLLDKYNDCLELVETDILEMFPIDEPQAFGGGNDSRNHSSGPRAMSNGYAQTTNDSFATPNRHKLRQKAIADSLRQQAIDQIQRDSKSDEVISTASSGMVRLRNELWNTRVSRMQMHQLANQTRKPSHIADAKAKDAELQRLSTYFLDRMRKSEEYQRGHIDLHGLTKEEALQLVEWKLRDSGRRRFKLITGRGTHSHNGHAVLRPALEKYCRSKGITVSVIADGILQIVP